MNQLKSFGDFTQADVERILGIVDKLNDIEVRLEVDGMKLHVRKFSEASPAGGHSLPQSAPAVQQAASAPQRQIAPPAPPAMPTAQPVPGRPLPAASVPAPAATADSGLLEVRAPMLGRFFRAPSASEPAYVEVGATVSAEDTVCLIEVMKLFNTVKAGVSSTIVEILVENGAMVEHDAVLFRVKPR